MWRGGHIDRPGALGSRLARLWYRARDFLPRCKERAAIHLDRCGGTQASGGARRRQARGICIATVSRAIPRFARNCICNAPIGVFGRSEEHTSELQSLMRISYAVFCLKKKTKNTNNNSN